MSQRPIRIAMVGGGPGSFIGGVHRIAAALDGNMVLVAGVFSRDPALSRERAEDWHISSDRVYANHRALIEGEAGRSDGVEAVIIATPNATHYSIAADALKAGLHVVCDKPMTATLAEAKALANVAKHAAGLFALTYTYTGYAMVREARARIAAGAIGPVRKVAVDYPQGWLSQPADPLDRQAAWRLDPAQAGLGGCIGDIGVHAFQLAEYVSGLRATSLCAMLSSVVPGRALDDDANVLLRLGDVPGVLSASQIATGHRNGLLIHVHGERASISWRHEDPGVLRIEHTGGSTELVHAGTAALSACARRATRLPPGHPEGFIEAFATIYSDVAAAILSGDRTVIDATVPGAEDGQRSMVFVDAAIESNRARKWVSLEEKP